MSEEQRAALFIQAWYEQGVRHGYYCSDVPYHSLRGDHKEQLKREALAAAHLSIVPKRVADIWTFIDA